MKVTSLNFEKWFLTQSSGVKTFLIYGQDPGQARIISRKIVAKESAAGEVEQKNYDYKEIKDDPSILTDDLTGQSLFGEKKVILIENVANTVTKELLDIIKLSKGDYTLILIADQLKPNSNIRKYAETGDNTASIACYADDEKTLKTFMTGFFIEKKMKVSRDTIDFLSQIVPPNRLLIQNELEKLCLYANNNVEGLDKEVLADIIGDASEIKLDELCYAFVLDKKHILPGIVRKIEEENTSFILVLRVVQKYLMRLLEIYGHVEGGDNIVSAVNKLKPPVFFKQKDRLMEVARATNKAKVKRKLKSLLNTEIAVKNTTTDPLLITLNNLLVA